jgi:hypothetical protein
MLYLALHIKVLLLYCTHALNYLTAGASLKQFYIL